MKSLVIRIIGSSFLSKWRYGSVIECDHAVCNQDREPSPAPDAVPEIGLNLTVRVPSLTEARSQMVKGNRPALRSVDVCANTFPLLGVESSLRIPQLCGPPWWVIATVQPSGTKPGLNWSKLT